MTSYDPDEFPEKYLKDNERNLELDDFLKPEDELICNVASSSGQDYTVDALCTSLHIEPGRRDSIDFANCTRNFLTFLSVPQ